MTHNTVETLPWLALAALSVVTAALMAYRWLSARRGRALVAGLCVFWVLSAAVQALEPRLYRLAAFDRQYSVARVADYDEFPYRPDVVFMGDSRSLSGFSPSVADDELGNQLGRSVHTFNLSMTGARMNLTYLALKNLIRDDKKPAVVVLGLSEFAFVPLKGENSTLTKRFPLTSTILRLDDSAFAERGAAGKARFVLANLLPLYRDSQLVRNALSAMFDPADPAHHWYAGASRWRWSADGSYIPPSGVRNPTSDDARRTYFDALQHFTLSDENLHWLAQFLDMARHRGIAVVLVDMPVSAVHRSWWVSPTAMAEYRASIREVALAHGVGYLDAYENMEGQIPEQFFWDTSHLNLDGSDLLTRRVARQYIAPLLATR